MAGWADITGAGSVSAGYVLDIKFFNAYINAILEKEQFINVSTGLTEIDDSEPYIISKSFIVSVIEAYKDFMNDVSWIRTARFDAPADYGPIDDDTDEIWTVAQIKTLITEDVYNIINDPGSASYGINDLLGAAVWNGMYLLYRDVFNIVEQRELKTSVLSFERWGKGSSPVVDSLQSCPAVNPGTESCTDDDLDDFKDLFDADTFALVTSGTGLSPMICNTSNDVRQDEEWGDPVTDTSLYEYSTYKRYQDVTAYSIRKHTIENFDGTLVKFSVSAQGKLIINEKRDSINKDPVEQTTSAWSSDFPEQASGDPATIQEFTFDSSVLTGTHWELTGYDASTIPYKGLDADFFYSFADFSTGDKTIGATGTVNLVTNFNIEAGFNGDADIYYKTNDSEMIYYIAP